MKNMRGLSILFFVLVCKDEVLSTKRIRVCIIGAGRSGLAAIKITADQIDMFEPIAFERNSNVGGLWIYRDDPQKDEHGMDAHSGIYKHLRTNIPLKYMAYPDYPDFYTNNNRTRVPHEVFLQYMQNYTDHFQLREYIKFDMLVTKVIPVEDNGDWRKTTWHMEIKNLSTGTKHTINCDAVMICNGHFAKPHIPEIPGLKETFPGQILHSRNYRKPEVFTNKTVVVLGAGSSGMDIAMDLGDYAKKTYLSQRHSFIMSDKILPINVQVVRGVVAANGSELILQNNNIINADTFIFCTGYEFSFPFLDERSGVSIRRRSVTPLHNYFMNAEHPSMAFIGLTGSFARTYYFDSRYFLNVLKGKQKLPSYEEMMKKAESSGNLFDLIARESENPPDNVTLIG